MQSHPQAPWIVAAPISPIALQLVCTRCRVGGALRVGPQADAFVAQHLHAAPRYYGAGDLFAGLAGLLGFKHCQPCDERQQAWNSRFPRMWPR